MISVFVSVDKFAACARPNLVNIALLLCRTMGNTATKPALSVAEDIVEKAIEENKVVVRLTYHQDSIGSFGILTFFV